jgi:hypothetical protein
LQWSNLGHQHWLASAGFMLQHWLSLRNKWQSNIERVEEERERVGSSAQLNSHASRRIPIICQGR